MVDKDAPSADNRGMNLSETELRQRDEAADKDARAIIARDCSASRMNATKWREVVEGLSDLRVRYRLRWVDVPEVSEWMSLWIPFPNSTYFDSAAVGPFRTFSIEWLEIDTTEEVHEGVLLKSKQVSHTAEVERRLVGANVPYEWVEGRIRITGYVRDA